MPLSIIFHSFKDYCQAGKSLPAIAVLSFLDIKKAKVHYPPLFLYRLW